MVQPKRDRGEEVEIVTRRRNRVIAMDGLPEKTSGEVYCKEPKGRRTVTVVKSDSYCLKTITI